MNINRRGFIARLLALPAVAALASKAITKAQPQPVEMFIVGGGGGGGYLVGGNYTVIIGENETGAIPYNASPAAINYEVGKLTRCR